MENLCKVKREYQAPATKRTVVELEDSVGTTVGSADIINSQSTETGTILEHETNTGFGGNFSSSEWTTAPSTNEL